MKRGREREGGTEGEREGGRGAKYRSTNSTCHMNTGRKFTYLLACCPDPTRLQKRMSTLSLWRGLENPWLSRTAKRGDTDRPEG